MSASSVEEAVRVVDQVLMDTLDMDPDIGDADIVLDALSAMPLASRLALARALVPEMVVVERSAAEKWASALTKMRAEQDAAGDGPIWSGYYMRVLMTENDLLAAIAAAEEPPHGP